MTFEVAGADAFGGEGYDLICVLNVLHELGDPRPGRTPHPACARPRRDVDVHGARTDENLVETVRARTFFSVSTLVCIPSALAQGADDALGAQAGEARFQHLVEEAGFTRFRRAAEPRRS